MMKTSNLLASAVVGAMALGVSTGANALSLGLGNLLDNNHLVATFEFNGTFAMLSPEGEAIPTADPRISGTIKLDFFTFGGEAAMSGVFLGLPFTANGGLSAYLDPLGFGVCDGNFLCADALIDFKFAGSNIPVSTSFALDPFAPLIRNLSQLKIGLEFDVTSIDRDGDGIPGTMLTEGLFEGITPSFSGVAKLTKLGLSPAIRNPGLSASAAPVPEPGEWAMLLAGLGLIGWRARRQLSSRA